MLSKLMTAFEREFWESDQSQCYKVCFEQHPRNLMSKLLQLATTSRKIAFGLKEKRAVEARAQILA